MSQRILMIDGCEQVLGPYKQLLEREGYEVFAAKSIDEGLTIIWRCFQEKKPVRVILYDPQFPNIERQSFLDVSGMPDVVSCIMHYDPELRKAAVEQFGLKGSRFLQKPFGRKEISEAVAEALREANFRWN